MSGRAELFARLPLLRADRWWLDLARASPDGRVIELGAGAGRLTAALVATGVEVTAVERDPAMLAQLQARIGGEAEVVAADVTALPELPPAGVVVLASSLVNELADGSARRAALAGAERCVQPSGTVALHLLGPWWLARLAGRSRGRLEPAGGGPPVEVTIEAGELDPWGGRRRATLTYAFPDGTVLVDQLDAAVVTPTELEADLAAVGLAIVSRFGPEPPHDAPRVEAPAFHLVCRRSGVLGTEHR